MDLLIGVRNLAALRGRFFFCYPRKCRGGGKQPPAECGVKSFLIVIFILMISMHNMCLPFEFISQSRSITVIISQSRAISRFA